ncbi:kinase-like protein [Neolentinus lepideus HHB14362 ss-1]|uniref:non-specific serine/threonine protein kinase n=1 Tax=Neolentinus lepideus HHB14362 ss-1 TaxID=1314782 RepID=A0A165QE76_9AGAM|nr:kinase-like protein [Neolentinus lepideus HHB14362 ss-1]
MAYLYWLFFTVLFVITTCICEPIALSGQNIKDRITALTQQDKRNLVAYKPNTYQPPPESFSTFQEEHLQALDITLLASVDGKFHALNRTNGAVLWSMSASSSDSAPATLGPLVRTTHVEYDPDLLDDDASQEQYIIEPQSGDIYVMASPTSPLQRLSFSMAQLVDMSPFSFSGEDGKIFVGKKETSLLLIELETGRIKATLNSECPWDPFSTGSVSDSGEIDLDELEEEATRNHMSVPTEVFIGRTDYHLSIYTRPSSPSSKPIVQNLSFSTYGPNNQDVAFQARYRRTPDDMYIQSLPDGKIMAWKTQESDSDGSREVDSSWARHMLSDPIVAVFDVLKSTKRTHPFVLLQPPLKLYEDGQPLPNRDKAYVGIVQDTGSLFAMTSEHYPLVAFNDVNYMSPLGIDPSPGIEFDGTLPPDIDAVTRHREMRRLLEMCRHGSTDRRCFSGVRTLESDSRSRLSRLLDESPVELLVPGAEAGPAAPHNTQVTEVPASGNESLSELRDPWGWRETGWTSLALSVSLVFLSKFLRSRSRAELKAPESAEAGFSAIHLTEEPISIDADALNTISAVQPHTQDNVAVAQSFYVGDSSAPVVDVQPPVNEDARLSENSGPNVQEVAIVDDGAEGEDSDKEGDMAVFGKRKTTRRKRGKKKKGNAQNVNLEDGSGAEAGQSNDKSPNSHAPEQGIGVVAHDPPPTNSTVQLMLPASLSPSGSSSQSLVVSDEVLGFGSHGTVVYRGSLQGRAVAVKRLLRDFVTLASREVSILQESDDHPNVIRYYYQEAHSNFLYIALELCPASLADVIEQPDQFRDISISFDPKRALREVTSGLRHLHSLKIVHRDIKPQNILVSAAKKTTGKYSAHRMLISDFGLCKKLDVDQTSFLPTVGGAMAVGTVGWRAPEVLRGEVNLDETLSDDQSQSSRDSVNTPGSGTSTGKPTRLTKAVDIFALGCLFYYVLTNGGHPFGDRYEREVNIIRNVKSLEGLDRFGEEGSDAVNLIGMMLDPEPSARPDTGTCLLHPYFWDAGRRLTFLQDVSDRFEIMCREPRDPNLVALEKEALAVVGTDWPSRLDKSFVENLGKFRKYNKGSVQDLLRALRNKKHHYQDLPDHVKRTMGGMPEGFLQYFTRRFPQLFLHVHGVVATSPLRDESMFRSYFELTD